MKRPPTRILRCGALASLLLALAGCGDRQNAQPAPAATPAPPVATAPSAPAGVPAEVPPAEPAAPGFRPADSTVEASEDNISANYAALDESAQRLRAAWQDKTFEQFEAETYREPFEGGKYIVNGDVAIADRKHLREFYHQLKKQFDETANGKLIVNRIGSGGRVALASNQINGRDDVWNSARRKELSYCVSSAFGARKDRVLGDMIAATEAWSKAADVRFVHRPEHDDNCGPSNANVVFDVRPVDVEGEYLARAFFPNDQRPARNVLIDESAFQLNPAANLQLVGILRHEIGHALGWRHEHTRPEAGRCFEDSNWKPLTRYDRFSVMHYPQCNGGGDWSLILTAADRAGSACVYGKGSDNSEDLSQCINNPPSAPVSGTIQTEQFADRSVAKSARVQFGPFSVKPGTLFEVEMTAAGAAAGDPDLYVRYIDKPDLTRWVCRPFLSGANERCELEVPANRSMAFVMVYGYEAGSFSLNVARVVP